MPLTAVTVGAPSLGSTATYGTSGSSTRRCVHARATVPSARIAARRDSASSSASERKREAGGGWLQAKRVVQGCRADPTPVSFSPVNATLPARTSPASFWTATMSSGAVGGESTRDILTSRPAGETDATQTWSPCGKTTTPRPALSTDWSWSSIVCQGVILTGVSAAAGAAPTSAADSAHSMKGRIMRLGLAVAADDEAGPALRDHAPQPGGRRSWAMPRRLGARHGVTGREADHSRRGRNGHLSLGLAPESRRRLGGAATWT